MSDRKIPSKKKVKDVSEVEMQKTGESNIFKPVTQASHSDGFAQPKGVQTRAAIATHLAKKLKIANQDVNTLMAFEKELRSNETIQDTFWENKLISERQRLEEIRTKQEQELQHVIDQAKLENFPLTEPTVVMMTHDLQDKLKRERLNSKSSGGGQNKYLISCNNPWRKRWSYLIIFVAIYSVVFIPMRIAVYPTVLDPVYAPLDIFTYILYVLDVFINLRTTYLDSFGEEIKSPNKIFTHYVYSVGFWIDMFSLLNYPYASHPILNIVGILKVNRFLKISTLITQSNMEKGPKIMMQMLYYYMLFIIYLHLVACMWFLFIESTYQTSKEDSRYKPWIPPYDYYDSNDNYWEKYEKGDEQIFLYLVCLYYSVLVIGGNEMGPTELQELVFMVVINLTGAIFQAYIFGELAVLIAQVGRKSQQQQEIIDTANTAMENVNLPQPLRKDIREYFKTIMQTMQQQNELDQFIKTISPSLALRVRGHMFENVLKDQNKIIKQTQMVILNSKGQGADSGKSSDKLPLSLTNSVASHVTSDAKKRADMLLETIVVTLGTSLNLPDEEIIKQDDYNEDELGMFFVGTGHCRVKVRDHNGREQVIGRLDEGDHFGELALIYKCKRSATVISSNYNTFARVLKPRFREIISEFPEYETCLKNNAIKNYRDKKIEFVLRMIKRVEYLEKHSEEVLFDLMFSLVPKTFEKDSTVLAEESAANALYFIEDGILEVYTKFENNEFVIEQLHKGSAINHRAFFMQDYMYVNIRCQTDAKILCLKHETMKALIEKYEDTPFGRDLLIYQNKILKQERKFPCDYVLRAPKHILQINESQAMRENALKNVVMRIIIEIRERKKRPKLADFIAVYREKKNEPGANKHVVKAEFQNKFRMLYGDEHSDEKRDEDKKFDDMMLSFNRLQDQLSTQQQQLGSVIKQVNALIDHRDKKENQILNKNRTRNGAPFKTAKAKASMKSRSQSTYVSVDQGKTLNSNPTSNLRAIIEEDKNAYHDENGSARQRMHEQELKAINDGYTNANEEPDSQNVTDMMNQGQNRRNGSQQVDKVFQPFKSPFTEEIINTSKEVNEQSQKTINEQSSHRSSGVGEAQNDGNSGVFRQQP